MTFTIWCLGVSVILLWTPVYLFFSSDIRDRIVDTQGSNGLPLLRIAATWQNWLDLLRGFVGSWLLFHHTFHFGPGLENGQYYMLALVGAILVVGVSIQVVYFRRHLFCLCPVFYLAGLSFGLVDWWMALYGLLAGLFFGGISNSSTLFFCFSAGTLAVAGYLFRGIDVGWLLASGTMLLPVVFSLSVQESLVAAMRRRALNEE